MPDLTPIPTEYNGHHFRSRLEARWAVFFDALGWRFEYEAEGYDLNGLWYLPDFWMPDLNCFIEIKPEPSDALPYQEVPLDEKALELAIRAKRRVLVAYGSPWPSDYALACHGPDHVLWFAMGFGLGNGDTRKAWIVGRFGAVCLNPAPDGNGYPDSDSPRLLDAYRAARSARFEHGESGRTL